MYRVITFILTLFVSGVVFAYDNELAGFRGIDWDTPLESNIMEMTQIEKDNKGVEYYIRRGETMQVGPGRADQIAYGYFNGRLKMAIVHTRGADNKRGLLQSLESVFGSGQQPNRFLDDRGWRGAVTTITYKCQVLTDECHAFFFSTRYLQEERARHEAALRNAKDAF
jgi:hypothetical protein